MSLNKYDVRHHIASCFEEKFQRKSNGAPTTPLQDGADGGQNILKGAFCFKTVCRGAFCFKTVCPGAFCFATPACRHCRISVAEANIRMQLRIMITLSCQTGTRTSRMVFSLRYLFDTKYVGRSGKIGEQKNSRFFKGF